MIARSFPAITTDTEAFWSGGAGGRLLINRCQDCQLYIHPPAPVCRRCHSRNVAAEAVSGRGSVYTYSINRHPWADGTEPYVVAVIELDEQSELFVTTNIVGCAVSEVTIDMPVEVEFERFEDAHIPLFHPSSQDESR
jgi:uncharacterized OB-fold protein